MSRIFLLLVLLAGCDLKAPSAPAMASAKADVEQCPLPILDIQGKWTGEGRPVYTLYGTHIPTITDTSFAAAASALVRAFYETHIPTITDTLQINALGRKKEPGLVYYTYRIESYSDESYSSEVYDNLPPNHLWYCEDGTMGMYYAGGGKWAFHYTIQLIRIWDAETGEYIEREDYSPSWDHDLRMFDDWLALGWGWDGDYLDYRRVHE